MSNPTAAAPGARGKLPLLALGIGAFVIGTSELVVVGILDKIAGATHVSVSTAGILVTAYALGIAIGGPLLSAGTMKLDRRKLLWTSLGVYVAGNVVAALAVNFGMLAAARVVTGSVHGLFIGVASVIAASLVPPEKQGQAMSMVFGGIAVSTVVGVPLGTAVGEAVGWHGAFFMVVILGIFATLACLFFVPHTENRGEVDAKAQSKHALAPRVLAMLGVGFVLYCGQFTAFTYLSPYLTKVTGVSSGLISLFLLAYGIAAAVGTFGGGRTADKSPNRSLIVANVVLIAVFLVLWQFGSSPAVVIPCLVLWGLFGFGMVPSLQLRTITLAGSGGDLAATLGASAVNLGIAIGALVGGFVVGHFSTSATMFAALVLVAAVLPATIASAALKPPVEETEESEDTEAAQDDDAVYASDEDRRTAVETADA